MSAKCSLGKALPVRVFLNLFDLQKDEEFTVGQSVPSILSLSPATGPTVGGTAVTLQLSSSVDNNQVGIRFGGNLCSRVTGGGSTAICAQTPAAAQAGPQPVVLEVDFGNILVSSASPFTYEGPPPAAGSSFSLVHLISTNTSGSGSNVVHSVYNLASDTLSDRGSLEGYPGDKTIGGLRASVIPSADSANVTFALAPRADGIRSWRLSDSSSGTAMNFDIPPYGNNWQTYSNSSPVSLQLGAGLVTASHHIFADNYSAQHIEVFRSHVALPPSKLGYVENPSWSGTAVDAFRSISMAIDSNNAFVAYVHPAVDFGFVPPHVRDFRMYVAMADLTAASSAILPMWEMAGPFSLQISQVSMISEVLPAGGGTKLHFALVADGSGLGPMSGCKVYYATATRKGTGYENFLKTPLWDLTDDNCTWNSAEFTAPAYRPQIIKTAAGIMIAGMRVQSVTGGRNMNIATVKSDSAVITWSPVQDLPPLMPFTSTADEHGRFFLNEASGIGGIVTWENYDQAETRLWQPTQNGSWPPIGKQLLTGSPGTTQLIGATIK